MKLETWFSFTNLKYILVFEGRSRKHRKVRIQSSGITFCTLQTSIYLFFLSPLLSKNTSGSETALQKEYIFGPWQPPFFLYTNSIQVVLISPRCALRWHGKVPHRFRLLEIYSLASPYKYRKWYRKSNVTWGCHFFIFQKEWNGRCHNFRLFHLSLF